MINKSNQFPTFCSSIIPTVLIMRLNEMLIVNLPLTIETNLRDSCGAHAYYYVTVMNQHIDL